MPGCCFSLSALLLGIVPFAALLTAILPRSVLWLSSLHFVGPTLPNCRTCKAKPLLLPFAAWRKEDTLGCRWRHAACKGDVMDDWAKCAISWETVGVYRAGLGSATSFCSLSTSYSSLENTEAEDPVRDAAVVKSKPRSAP